MDSTPKRSADPQRHVPTNKDKCLKNDFNNADAAATSDPTESEKSKTANINSQSKNGNNDPSSNSPDPRRTPLLSRIPFAPTPISKRTRGGIGATAMGSPRGKKDVTPAYAYKNAETGLLEIRTVIPPSLSMVGNEDDTVVGLPEEDKKDATKLALYPIALNGGRAGLYNDPRDFLPAHSSWELCRNNRADGLSTNPSKGHVKFEHPNSHRKEMLQGAVSNAYTNLDVDLETGLKNALSNDNADTKSAEPRPRQSFGTLMTAVNPWKIWEHIHNEMSRVAAHKTRQLEDESSHATIARQKNKASMVSSIYNDNDFDFALVLAPHEAYAFWAHHLDFREEALHFIDDPGIDLELEEKGLPDDNSTIATNQRAAAATKCEIIAKTPIDASGLRRRKRATPTSEHVNSSNKMNSSKVSSAISPGIRHPSHASPYRIRTAEKMGNRIFQQRKSLFERAIIDRISPKRGSDGSAVKNSCNITTAEESISSDPENFGHPTPASDIKSPYVPRRRWGNAYDNNRLSTPNLTSPPIVSLKKGSSVKKRVKSNQKKNGGSFLFPNLTPGGRKEKQKVPGKSSVYGTGTVGKKVQGSEYIDRNVKPKSNKRTRACSDLDDKYNNADVGTDSILPSTSIPRGISARINGLGAFLEALKIGIVVRRHCPRGKAAFVKLFSDDGGDTIEFLYITDDEALIALREQEQRYNSRRRRKKARISFGESDARRWSGDSQTINKRDKIDTTVPLPDYLKAKIDREEDIRKKGGLKNAITHGAMNWLHAGVIRASEIVQVHPAAHVDPYSKTDQLGTPSLRLSQTPYVKSNTFSVILPSMQGKLVKQHFPSADMTEKWCHGSGHRSLFRSYDFEAATEGEYWVIFRGLLQIHRDASSGRFAAHRAGGFGSMTKYSDVMDVSENRVAENNLIEVLPQPEKTKLFHQVLKNFRVIERSNAASPPQIPIALANPPPPDYFLGFSSPGTQIWGRLRQAGLETQRLYSLDTKKVMIKVRCPVDRLQDVAEALKLKLKTKEGDYAPFREDMVSHFLPTNDGFVSYDDGEERIASLFRSSERQKIIDFVIGSRIRDSGAELGASTPLGKHIQRRVPLHSHARLEALYKCWVLFWLRSNWNNRDGRGLRVDSSKLNSPISSTNSRSMKHCYSKEEKSIETVHSSSAPGEQELSPSFLYRLVVGCFYQPLDSIEEYYGEKVAFYFAWLQHCSFHLLYLSFVGAIVFICQLSSGNWDHPLRPFFSIFVMIWSFVVMVTWRRRSNFLAYQWGTLDYQEEEIARPEFKGTEYRVCPITNTYVMYYPPWKRWLKMCVSIPLTVGFTIVTLLGILILYGNRDVMLAQYFATGHSYHISVSMDVIGQTAPILAVKLNKEHLRDPDFWIIIIGFPTALGLILPLLNFCLRKVSLWLNELENHRTEAEYRTHFIIKVFAFRFVCYFAALYYYSFIGVGTTDPQATEHGIVRVASTLFTYITIAHWWNICINVFFPLLLYRWRIYRDRLRLKKELRKLEKAELELTPSLENCLSAEKRLEKKKQLLNKRLLLEHAQANIWEEIVLPEHDSFTEYLFAVTQFAYVTCFSVILPITPLIVLFNHLLNMRLDAFKLCRGRRRPLALKTGGIGVWNHVLHVVTVIAILTNCSLMALTSSQFSWLANEIGTLGVFALAIGWEHFMLLVKYIMQLTVSRMPQTVQDEIRRKKYDQERKRYMQLRLKKRNSSYGTTEKKKSSITSSKKSPSVFKKDEQVTDCSEITKSTRAVACPPIEEASSNMSGSSIFEGNDERTSFDDLAEAIKHLPQPPVPSNEDVKNYALHQSFTDSSRGGSKRKANKSKVINTSPFANTILENHNPNLEKSAQIKRRPSFTQPHNRSPLQSRNPYLGYSPQLDNQGRAQREEHEEEVISPTSTITTVQYPTPRQLHPTGDDDSLSTLSTVRPGTNTNCFYHNATAPPMPADDFDEHSETQFHEIFLSDDTGDVQRSPLYDTPTHLTQARWGIHHSLYFNHSERISEKKKSR